jgi:hypothetical protein
MSAINQHNTVFGSIWLAARPRYLKPESLSAKWRTRPQLINVDSFLKTLIRGLILLATLAVDVYAKETTAAMD